MNQFRKSIMSEIKQHLKKATYQLVFEGLVGSSVSSPSLSLLRYPPFVVSAGLAVAFFVFQTLFVCASHLERPPFEIWFRLLRGVGLPPTVFSEWRTRIRALMIHLDNGNVSFTGQLSIVVTQVKICKILQSFAIVSISLHQYMLVTLDIGYAASSADL